MRNGRLPKQKTKIREENNNKKENINKKISNLIFSRMNDFILDILKTINC